MLCWPYRLSPPNKHSSPDVHPKADLGRDIFNFIPINVKVTEDLDLNRDFFPKVYIIDFTKG